ncbi:hypothetical protein WICPIJ_008519 [Wickerhamomyces pijperi]|uniref:Uncharacterized protein n=1 Tax=Wickerhamomyces pijperi TaxID=599730 RepID=A0A9P8PYB0_WICPI|nr:hypothetical protein WICPIJ_008519 [Wickerhamomyces pijperi]
MFLMALPDKIPCVTMAMTDLALFSSKTSAALAKVPQVSAISSTIIQILSVTSPTSTILDTSLALALSLWIKAKFKSKRSAKPAALLAPPASGEMMIASSKLTVSRIHQLGSDWSSGLVLTILTSIWEVWNDSSDTASRGGLTGVDHNQQFQNPIVDNTRSDLNNNVDVFISNRFLDGEGNLTTGVTFEVDVGQLKT